MSCPMGRLAFTMTTSRRSFSMITTSSRSHSTGAVRSSLKPSVWPTKSLPRSTRARHQNSRCGSSRTRWAASLRGRCRSSSRATWDRMMESDGARILMLGTPNGGSWAPMQVLSGDDTFGNLLINVGAPFGGNASRKLIANFPGIHSAPGGSAERSGHRENLERISQKSDLEAMRSAQPMAQFAAAARSIRVGYSSRKACLTKRWGCVVRSTGSGTLTSPPSPTNSCSSSARRNPHPPATNEIRRQAWFIWTRRTGRRPGHAGERCAAGGGHLGRGRRSWLAAPAQGSLRRISRLAEQRQDGSALHAGRHSDRAGTGAACRPARPFVRSRPVATVER